MEEVWKDVVWYEWLYQVNNLWYVRSLDRTQETQLKHNKYRTKKWKILKLATTRNWYNYIVLSVNNKKINKLIHRLVAQAFIQNQENKPQVNHINWIKTDNRVENLERCTASENWLHSFRILWNTSPNKWKFGKDNHCSKKVWQYDVDWNIIKIRENSYCINRELWFTNSSICMCCNWQRKTSHSFIWKYI